MRGLAQSTFPLGLVSVPGISLWVKIEKAVVFVVQIGVVVSDVGAHAFLRVKRALTPRLRTAYDMVHSYFSTTTTYKAVGQRPPRVFRSQMSVQAFSSTSLLLISVQNKQMCASSRDKYVCSCVRVLCHCCTGNYVRAPYLYCSYVQPKI